MPFELSPPAARPTTVLFDVMGTVLRLEDPVARLRGALAARGIERSADEAAQALSAEIAVYRARHLEGRDAASIDRLRRACAAELRAALGAPLDPDEALHLLMDTLRFVPLDGTSGAIDRLRAAGIRTAAVSNWDASLDPTLRAIGLREHFDAVVTSADVGVDKPDPAPLVRALELLGAETGSAVMVGDDPVDAGAAETLGIPCVLVEPGAGIAAVVDELLALAP